MHCISAGCMYVWGVPLRLPKAYCYYCGADMRLAPAPPRPPNGRRDPTRGGGANITVLGVTPGTSATVRICYFAVARENEADGGCDNQADDDCESLILAFGLLGHGHVLYPARAWRQVLYKIFGWCTA